MNIKGKPITDVIGELNNGDFIGDLTDELYALIKAVSETRKAGKLTITMNVKPTGRDTVSVAADFSSKKPEDGRPETTFFIGKDFSLQRKDPKQPDLPLREVPRYDEGQMRVVGDAD